MWVSSIHLKTSSTRVGVPFVAPSAAWNSTQRVSTRLHNTPDIIRSRRMSYSDPSTSSFNAIGAPLPTESKKAVASTVCTVVVFAPTLAPAPFLKLASRACRCNCSELPVPCTVSRPNVAFPFFVENAVWECTLIWMPSRFCRCSLMRRKLLPYCGLGSNTSAHHCLRTSKGSHHGHRQSHGSDLGSSLFGASAHDASLYQLKSVLPLFAPASTKVPAHRFGADGA